MYASFASIALNLVLNVSLMWVLGYLAFPLSTTLAAILNVGILYALLPRKVGPMETRAAGGLRRQARRRLGGRRGSGLAGEPAPSPGSGPRSWRRPASVVAVRRSRPGRLLRRVAPPRDHRDARLSPPLPPPLRRGQTYAFLIILIGERSKRCRFDPLLSLVGPRPIIRSPHGRSAAGVFPPMSDEAVARRAGRSALTRPDELLKDLGLDVELHHRIFDSIDRSFRKTVLAQKDRPEGMAYFDGVITGAHGERVREIVDRGAKPATSSSARSASTSPTSSSWPSGRSRWRSAAGRPSRSPTPRRCCRATSARWSSPRSGLALSNTCPYGPIEDLAVGETTCDAKKKTWDILAKGGDFHVLEVPQKKGARDRDLWHEEVRPVQGPARGADRPDARDRKARRGRGADEQEAAGPGPAQRLPEGGDPPISGLDALVVMQGALVDDTLRFTERLEALNDELEDRVRRGVGVAAGRGQADHGLRLPLGHGQLEAPPPDRVRRRRRRLRRDLHGHALFREPRRGDGRRPRRPARGHRRPLPQDRLLVLLAERRAHRFGHRAGAGASRRRRGPVRPPVLPHLQHRGHRRGRAPSRRPASPASRSRPTTPRRTPASCACASTRSSKGWVGRGASDDSPRPLPRPRPRLADDQDRRAGRRRDRALRGLRHRRHDSLERVRARLGRTGLRPGRGDRATAGTS